MKFTENGFGVCYNGVLITLGYGCIIRQAPLQMPLEILRGHLLYKIPTK